VPAAKLGTGSSCIVAVAVLANEAESDGSGDPPQIDPAKTHRCRERLSLRRWKNRAGVPRVRGIGWDAVGTPKCRMAAATA
jgi:hypothetical protein